MFYEPDKRDTKLLRYDPFKAIVAPRPIGWVTSMSGKGEINLAPYSYFNGICSRPNLVMFASEGLKDSVSLHRRDRRIRVQPRHLGAARADERDLGAAQARRQRDGARGAGAGAVAAGEAAAGGGLALRARMPADQDRADERCRGTALDCHVVFGQVVGVHIDDRFIKDGLLDTAALKPIARCGYDQYAVVEQVFAMTRPTS